MTKKIATYWRIIALDIAVGILVVGYTTMWFGVNVAGMGGFIAAVICGVVLGLLPDLTDMAIAAYIKYTRKDSAETFEKICHDLHHKYSHYPLTWLAAALVVGLISPMVGVAIGLAIIWHFFHDSFYLGWGVQWLWPFSKQYYKFFSPQVPMKDKDTSWNFVAAWTQEERADIIRKYGDFEWLENLWAQWSTVAIFENILAIGVFVLALFVLFI